MNSVLILGGGGREHSLAWKLAASPQVKKIYAAPGNPGMAGVAELVNLPLSDFAGLADFAENENISLTIVGPEVPLIGGIVDYFQERGLKIFGPRANAAIIEGSKVFAKDLMKVFDIPTAYHTVCESYDFAVEYVCSIEPPFVIKADGLAAGKGVVIAETVDEAKAALFDMMENKCFGEAGKTVVIEEFLTGTEFSFMAFVNGKNVYPMLTARDHKRAFDNDKGPNTGGMGAYAPVPEISAEKVDEAINKVLIPVAKAMENTGRSFCGVLFAGLISTAKGIKVIEFNARFGDPETEVVLPLLKNDLFQVITDVMAGKDPQLTWSNQAALGVVLASKGYPGAYKNGFPIHGLSDLERDTLLFHCGTAKAENGGFATSGGRVLFAARKSGDIKSAAKQLYKDIKKIKCDNLFYRNDIGGSSDEADIPRQN